jgi:hypothetical protein
MGTVNDMKRVYELLSKILEVNPNLGTDQGDCWQATQPKQV